MARRSSQPVNRHWTPFTAGSTFAAQTAGAVGVAIGAAQHDRETILRTRGTLLAYADGSPATGALVRLAAGMILVPEGTGTTVLWSPITDGDAPWFWYTSFFVGYEEYVTDVIDSPVVSSYREVIDTKAMRRVRNTEVQLVVENQTLGGALTENLFVTGRFLTQE